MSDNLLSRRQVMGLGAGLAAMAALPAFAQGEADQAQNRMSGVPLQDPRTKFPQPPFKGQEQPWPGLASRMEPRPDHGETSYRGSGRLAGRKALITGGDSGMGRAAAMPLPGRVPTSPLITFPRRSRMRVRSSL